MLAACRTAALLPLLFVGALACTRTLPAATHSDSEPTARREHRATNSDPNAITPSDGVVVLVDAGDEPHAPLRYHPQVGDVARWKMTMLMGTTVNVLGSNVQTQFGIEFSSQTEVVAVDEPAHEHEYRSTFQDARLLMEVADPGLVEAAIAPYMDLEYWVRTDARGQALEVRYSRNGEPVDPSTIDGLDNTTAVMLSFPEEPVGIGARWLEYDEVERNGFRVLQRSEHRLVRRTGDQLEIESTVSQEPLSMTMVTNDMPAGTRVELRYFSASGGGKSTHSLELAVPIAAQAQVELELAAVIFADQQQSDMTMNLAMETVIQRSE